MAPIGVRVLRYNLSKTEIMLCLHADYYNLIFWLLSLMSVHQTVREAVTVTGRQHAASSKLSHCLRIKFCNHPSNGDPRPALKPGVYPVA